MGKLNLALAGTQLGDKFKMLSVVGNRSDNKMLGSNEALLLELVGEPYLHFEFREQCKITDVAPKKKTKCQSKLQNECDELDSTSSPHSWALSDEEKEFVLSHYVKNTYGYGKIAKDILSLRGIKMTEENVANMKSPIKRFIEKN